MNFKTVFALFFVTGLFLSLSSCGMNLFSSLIPSNESETTPSTLNSLGDYYMSRLDYTNAYRSYSKAMQLAPSNSVSIWGAVTAYVNMRISPAALLGGIQSGGFSKLGFNTLYNSGAYTTTNLQKILEGNCDQVISKDNPELNFSYYLFSLFYSVYLYPDTDNNGNVEQDTNDLIVLYPDNTISNRFTSLTNSFLEYIGSVYILKQKRIIFSNITVSSTNSIAVYSKALTSQSAKDMLSSVTQPMESLRKVMSDSMTNLDDLYLSNTLLVSAPGTNSFFTNIYMTNYSADPAGYASFMTDVSNEGMTSVLDFQFALPDFTDVESLMTNYFQIPNL